MVIVDTSIIIDHLRQPNINVDTPLIELSKKLPKFEIGISVLSIQELYTGLSTKDTLKENYLKLTISPMIVVPYTYEIAIFAGKIIRDAKTSITFADAGIAASCIYNHAKLLTLNNRDFIDIQGLTLY